MSTMAEPLFHFAGPAEDVFPGSGLDSANDLEKSLSCRVAWKAVGTVPVNNFTHALQGPCGARAKKLFTVVKHFFDGERPLFHFEPKSFSRGLDGGVAGDPGEDLIVQGRRHDPAIFLLQEYIGAA